MNPSRLSTMMLRSLVLLSAWVGIVHGFVPYHNLHATPFVIGGTSAAVQNRIVGGQVATTKDSQSSTSSSSSTRLNAAYISTLDMQTARSVFWLCFLAATGTAGVGRAVFPQTYDRFMSARALKGVGPTRGGPTLGLSPLAGYPEDIAIKDVESIANNNMTVADMIAEYQEQTDVSAMLSADRKMFARLLSFDSFKKANEGNNPLALRAIFDTFGQGSSLANPVRAQQLLYEYQEDANNLKMRLNNSKLLALSAIFVLIVLLGVADGLVAFHLYKGWFPTWPGGESFPDGMFDGDTALQAIPRYWMDKVPDADGFY